jgi:predicted nucleic acid-binding protein
MAKTYQLKDFNQLTGQNIFFDANVLIYLYFSMGQQDLEETYAKAFKNLIKQGNGLYVDFLVISEVINRVMRHEHHRINSGITYKNFRNSTEGKDALQGIYTQIKNDILRYFKIIGKSFDTNSIENFLQIDSLDFIDKAIVETCKENKFILFTHDGDFKDCGLDLLSNNKKLYQML